jgi:sporulation protein YlmC with PRC-barrel domain
MKASGKIKLVSQLLDLPLIDKDGNYSGVVDDLEFAGSAHDEAQLAVLLVGPGAYRGRLPDWAMWLVRMIAGNRITRVPIDAIVSIDSAVHLKRSAEDLGLHRSEARARAWIPHGGAM